MHRWWGYRKESFLTEIRTGLADPTTVVEKLKRYETNPDLRTALALASNCKTTGEMVKVVNYYKDAAKFDRSNDYAYELYSAYRRGLNRPFSLDDVTEATDAALASALVTQENKLKIYDQMCTAIIQMRGNEAILGYIKDGQTFAQNISNKNLKYQKDHIQIAYTLYIEKNETEAVRLKKISYKEDWMEDSRNLNSFSWWCFEHQINLNEANDLARRGVKLAEPGSQKAMILDTVAEIEFLQGNRDEAIKLIKEAINDNPESDYYPKQLTRFEKPSDSTN